MADINVRVENRSNNPEPEYKTRGSSGMDVRAFIQDTDEGRWSDGEGTYAITIPPGGRAAIPTGLYFENPEGYEIQVRPRSGLAINDGVTVLNTPGTVDDDYRGEVKVIMINHSTEEFWVKSGDRIAQLVWQKVPKANLIVVESLNKTERGAGGFGSTGK